MRALPSMRCFNHYLLFQQEENNNVQSDCEGSISELPDGTHTIHKSAQSMLEMRKYTMAAANPILAEKLSTPSDPTLQPLTTPSRLQVTPLTPKIERGRFVTSNYINKYMIETVCNCWRIDSLNIYIKCLNLEILKGD